MLFFVCYLDVLFSNYLTHQEVMSRREQLHQKLNKFKKNLNKSEIFEKVKV